MVATPGHLPDHSAHTLAISCVTGYRIFADTSVRLWHIGTYNYGWKDALIVNTPRKRRNETLPHTLVTEC
ncbi:MAG: hypothetical protein GXY83_09090 [Rhodopirellula sp.]|nr:hypothetical protein [Rhodopirellula sp.]